MWLDALASISKFNKTQLNISSSFEEDTKIKNVSTFSELVDKMASLMFCQAHILKHMNTKKVPGLIILIDHIDKADELEEGLSRRLLSMDEVSSIVNTASHGSLTRNNIALAGNLSHKLYHVLT
jgi:hypothetical protein